MNGPPAFLLVPLLIAFIAFVAFAIGRAMWKRNSRGGFRRGRDSPTWAMETTDYSSSSDSFDSSPSFDSSSDSGFDGGESGGGGGDASY